MSVPLPHIDVIPLKVLGRRHIVNQIACSARTMSRHDPSLGEPRNAWRGDEIARSAQATLYQATGSYGCQVARLALVEKGVAFKSRYVDLNSDTTQVRADSTRARLWGVSHSAVCSALWAARTRPGRDASPASPCRHGIISLQAPAAVARTWGDARARFEWALPQ
jgi:hypothetical protein